MTPCACRAEPARPCSRRAGSWRARGTGRSAVDRSCRSRRWRSPSPPSRSRRRSRTPPCRQGRGRSRRSRRPASPTCHASADGGFDRRVGLVTHRVATSTPSRRSRTIPWTIVPATNSTAVPTIATYSGAVSPSSSDDGELDRLERKQPALLGRPRVGDADREADDGHAQRDREGEGGDTIGDLGRPAAASTATWTPAPKAASPANTGRCPYPQKNAPWRRSTSGSSSRPK